VVAAGTLLSSTVFAFDVQDLTVVWSTTVNSDTSNFVTKTCANYVWIMTQNQTTAANDTQPFTVVRKLSLMTGELQNDWALNTSLSNAVQNIGVDGGQIMVLAASGHLTLAFVNGTVIASRYRIPVPSSCDHMPFSPMLLNATTWFAVCGTYVVMWDANSGRQLPSFIAPHGISCGAVRPSNSDFVFAADSTSYIATASGVRVLSYLPDVGVLSACTGLAFDVSNDDTAYQSINSYYGGLLLVLNVSTGAVISQAVASVSPFGPPAVDRQHRGLFVANINGYVIQGYSFVPPGSTTSFSLSFYNHTTSSLQYPFAYNPVTSTMYYLSMFALYTISLAGAVDKVANFSFLPSVATPLTFVEHFVIAACNDNAFVFVFDTVANTIAYIYGYGTFEVDDNVSPLVFGSKVVLFSSTDTDSAYVIDTRNQSTYHPIPADSSRTVNGAALLLRSASGGGGGVLVVNTGASSICGYNISDAMRPLFNTSQSNGNITSIISAPVAADGGGGGAAYFVAQVQYGAAVAVFMVTALGDVREVGVLASHTTSAVKFLIIKSSGSAELSQPTLYVFGDYTVAAYTLGWKSIFSFSTSNMILSSPSPLTEPTLLPAGLICFYTTSSFTVLHQQSGELAWEYAPSNGMMPAMTDGINIYFSDGEYVIAADARTGAVQSLSSYGLGTLQGQSTLVAGSIALVVSSNTTSATTLVIGATAGCVVFAYQPAS
jgi:hypothetical protein